MPAKYTPEQRINTLWSNINKNGSIPAHMPHLGKCWEWLAFCDKDGYGKCNFNRQSKLVHRIVWELINGLIPNGLSVLHKCDNPRCCNPEHLFLGTHLDNNRDMVAKGRNNPSKGEKQRSHKLTELDVIAIRKRYANGEKKVSKLANEYGVNRNTIYDVINRKYWNWLDKEI